MVHTAVSLYDYMYYEKSKRTEQYLSNILVKFIFYEN